jgi:hypothetical protein
MSGQSNSLPGLLLRMSGSKIWEHFFLHAQAVPGTEQIQGEGNQVAQPGAINYLVHQPMLQV